MGVVDANYRGYAEFLEASSVGPGLDIGSWRPAAVGPPAAAAREALPVPLNDALVVSAVPAALADLRAIPALVAVPAGGLAAALAMAVAAPAAPIAGGGAIVPGAPAAPLPLGGAVGGGPVVPPIPAAPVAPAAVGGAAVGAAPAAAGVGGLAALAAALAGPGVGGGGGVGAVAAPGAGPSVDARVLVIARDTAGKQYQDFRSCIALYQTTSNPDWPVRGPRTALWCFQHMLRIAGGAIAWDMRWRALARKTEGDEDARHHEFLCRTLETFVSFDQVNAPNLAGVELLCRQLQLLEERVYEAELTALSAKKKSDSGLKSAYELVDSGLFLGTTETKSNLCICPALSEWISEQLRAEAAVAKERRKAREERAARA